MFCNFSMWISDQVKVGPLELPPHFFASIWKIRVSFHFLLKQSGFHTHHTSPELLFRLPMTFI
jgi:hypothetical protein